MQVVCVANIRCRNVVTRRLLIMAFFKSIYSIHKNINSQ